MENNTVLSLTEAIRGETVYYNYNGMKFPVIIDDIRKVWGRIDVKITPIGGVGCVWVEASKVTFK